MYLFIEKNYQLCTKFNEIYKKIAEENNCYFIDNTGLETGVDRIHLTKESHAFLAEKLKEKIINGEN